MNWILSTNKTWGHLEKQFDWVAAMRDVPQDALYHAEGNVAVHTQMVLEALTSDIYYKALPASQQELLWTAALLHDVEKRSTTITEQDGRITSHGHARKGEYTSRQVLYHLGMPFQQREQVAALVRLHGLPLWLMEKTDPVKALLGASLRIDMPLLALIARADVSGRICNDQQQLLERIDFFQAYCEEVGCWQGPKSFASDLARFVYFHKEESHPEYIPFDDLRSDVIMLSGLPGMGKDRYIKKHYADWPVVSLDDIRRQHKFKPDDITATGQAVQMAKEQAREYLRKGERFIWNATNITRQMRSQWIDLFATYKARVRIIYIEVPHREWVRQNYNREHVVPENVLMRLLRKLEVPLPYEAHSVEYIVE
ncbi:MAG TPA: ATP-binding protein [Ohtaekwangia sp.]|uniref:ATP-binding protein n=1 Tax=Ohtaekwangia sp. TaxID=2066019 RepID=UPI002F927F2B